MPQSFAEHLKAFPLSPNLGQSLERAHGFARDQSHRLVTLEHLLLALTEDPEAVIILQAANVDLARLTTDVSGHLGRLLEDMRAAAGVEPRPDPELLRVLQAAATAALQSKRKQIDGAIVLAAVVGDGKSPAAGMLKALGMTFEEAIRALQRANTKARLKPQTKSPAPAAAGASTPQPSPAPAAASTAAPAPKPAAPAAATPANGARKPEPVLPEVQFTTQQTAEEILAAARERIRQRAAAARAEREAAAQESAPAAPVEAPTTEEEPEPEPPPEPAAEPQTLARAIEAAMAAAAPAAQEQPAAPAPAPTPTPTPAAAAEPQAQATPTPPGDPRPAPASRFPPLRRTQGPPLPRPIQPHEGPPRPPLPLRQGPRPQAKFPPQRAPWPEPADPSLARRAPLPNGNLGGVHHPPREGYGPASPWPVMPSPPQRAVQSERGPLVENVPRVMRVGTPVPVEVRIARDKIESLIVALKGRGAAYRPDTFVTRAVSVRLRAPQGGFWIEADSPETQWAETASSLPHDEYAVWRWTVLPHRRGPNRLLLSVSARTVGHDGIASESVPPDRVIEVRVRSNKARGLGRLLTWLIVLSAGAAIAHYGQPYLEPALAAIRKLVGG